MGSVPRARTPADMRIPGLRCLSLDLEVGKGDGRIRALGAVRSDTGRRLAHSGAGLAAALVDLDRLADGASCVLGHNLIAFDLPHLAAAGPDLKLLKLPVVDTLRLSPLAFPRNPYHHLVKHYQDGGLRGGQVNDPALDADLALQLLEAELCALRTVEPDLRTAWHWLCTPDPEGVDRALNELFAAGRGAARPTWAEARAAMVRRLEGAACSVRARACLEDPARHGWALAYVLAWLSVAGGNSVLPPWVLRQFPEAGRRIRELRDTACTDPDCGWCRTRHDSRHELRRWFGFDHFRPEPADENGRPLQQAIVETAMAGRHVLGILPTGTGKSVCYQVPALSRYDKTGALTVVVSPLVALMADQVTGLEKRGISCCVTVNGLLSMPERADALDRIRLGDAGIVLISPEQLRGRAFRRTLDQREIGAWVLDEAHCLSRWGHDFRPDYRYVGRFIREQASRGPVPPVLCLTATARPPVIEDIERHFRDRLGIALTVFNGGTERTNLAFEVVPTSTEAKFAHIHQVLLTGLPPDGPGGAIVYCATRRQSEEVAEYLQLKDVSAGHFHARVPPDTKRDVQQRFVDGDLRVIAATNAFGMGIDKPDVRLVIHADIPGSLENYLQEAGRAGRDRAAARCVLMYAVDDVERQFGMSARGRLTRREIDAVLRALRRLDRKKRLGGEVVATAGEILGEEEEHVFGRDSSTDDTRMRTAVAWLEESELLRREENVTSVFPSSLRVHSLAEARRRLSRTTMSAHYRGQLLKIVEALFGAGRDEGVSTDELMGISGLGPERVRHALHDLERLGIASNDVALTAFVHAAVERSSRKRLVEAAELETALIAHMRETAPDLGRNQDSLLNLRMAAHVLRDQGLANPLPERIWRIVRSLAWDGRGEADGAVGSLSVRKRDAETVHVRLRRAWSALEETADLRRTAAAGLLEHLLGCLPAGARGTDLLAETTLGRLREVIESDIELKSRIRNPDKLLDRALLWLHEQETIRLNRGLVVFRPAMTLRLRPVRHGFSSADFEPLALHYQGQVLQIHVMTEFAKRGLVAMSEALRLAMDYFSLQEKEFLARWLPGRDREIGRETTPESWQTIVGSLKNPVQQRIVADPREQTNVLVLAGPGSGKTRVLVHRIAYLVRVKRADARGILALAYNRHAAVEIRLRLKELLGVEARRVTVLTCHGLAMRLAGFSFAGWAGRPGNEDFRDVLRRAIALLRGEDLAPDEADARRERLLAGFRWILVDEYQDVGPEEYGLISALAGRTLKDETGKLALFAVGDDDQNIYAFKGASVAFIRRFETDYDSRPAHLTENYRSSGHIVAVANAVIEPADGRMKVGHPIRVDRARAKDPPGGAWEQRDPVSRGAVQILEVGRDPVEQAHAVLTEWRRLAELAPDWDWARCAVLAREWAYLIPVRAVCEAHGIPVQMANEEIPAFWYLRETRSLVAWLRARGSRVVDGAALSGWIEAQPSNPWHDLLRQAIREHALETDDLEVPVDQVIEWLAEWGRDMRRRQRGVLLSTAHRGKGLEFDHVAVLDGSWDRVGRQEDPDAPRRLYYVAVTRARQTLTLARFGGARALQDALVDHPSVVRRRPARLPPVRGTYRLRRRTASLEDVDLGFAGRCGRRDPVHGWIAALTTGDALAVRVREDEPWQLLDAGGRRVGRLARSFRPPPGMRCRRCTVAAIVVRSRELSDPQYRGRIRSEEWEVVIPEFVFEPVADGGAGAGARPSPGVEGSGRR